MKVMVGVLISILTLEVCLWGGCAREGGSRDAVEVNARDATGESVSYAALRAENEALRSENQMFRRELISKNGTLPDSVIPEKGVATDSGLKPSQTTIRSPSD